MEHNTPPADLIFTTTALQIGTTKCWPNSSLPAVIYSPIGGAALPAVHEIKKRLAENGYSNTWMWTVYDFDHYHSNTHEVLVCLEGSANLVLGGPDGTPVAIDTGMALLIPAGVAHRRVTASNNFTVLGAYPHGMAPDMRLGKCSELAEAYATIHAVPLPGKDPLLGAGGGIAALWKPMAY